LFSREVYPVGTTRHLIIYPVYSNSHISRFSLGEQAAARLTALESKVTFNRHALSSDAVGLLTLRNQLNDLLCQGQIIAAHPYQFNVENNAKQAYHLSPINAVNSVSNNARKYSLKLMLQVTPKPRPTNINTVRLIKKLKLQTAIKVNSVNIN